MTVDSMIGSVLGGRYEIESLIGSGGMAAVYKCYDSNLRRTVAIKIIHTALSENADFTRRFKEEATAVARLRHPNILQVFDYSHDNNLYYMVMEFIAGETLQSRLTRFNSARRLMPVMDAVHFAAEVCDAADYAHQRGLIHRDIKPANIMLDVLGKAILMDFGVAQIVGGIQHTATGAVVGTARYMSPEQVQGIRADVRADIYSIGVTLFEMLAGKPPFVSENVMTQMMMHLNDPVPDVRTFQPETPAAVASALQKALAKTREQRYQSAAEMAAALRLVDRAPAGLAPVTPAIRQPGKPIDATYIEASAMLNAQETIIARQGTAPAAAIPGAAQAQPAWRAQPAAPKVDRAAAFPATPEQTGAPVASRMPSSKAWVIILLAVVILIGVGGFFALQQLGFLGGGNEAALPDQSGTITMLVADMQTAEALRALPQQTKEPIAQPATPTSAQAPAETATPAPAAVVVGGADKIAWINNSDIWTANLDGSGLTQLTTDGGLKTYLRWLPGGQGLSYIKGKCIRTISLLGVDQVVACFNNAKYLDSFEPSPDGSQVVIGLDRLLYLLPFDLAGLANAQTHGDLTALAVCKELAPYRRNFGRSVRWSKDGKMWAALVLGVLKTGRGADLIQVFDVDRCIPNPIVKAQFPEPHFTYPGYEDNPIIQNFAWDGTALFAFNDFVRNDGFGNLHIFNMDRFQPILSINPVEDVCCYRDPQWSPDGSHLLFAFQNYLQGSNSTTQLYMIPYGDVGTGSTFTALPLPEITDSRESPQPVLRPAVAP